MISIEAEVVLLILATVLLILAVVIGSIGGYLVNRGRLRRFQTSSVSFDVLSELLEKFTAQNVEISQDDKAEIFLNIPNVVFYFVDEKQINNFYTGYFREPTIVEETRKIVGEVSGGLEAGIPKTILAKTNTNSIEEWVGKIHIPDLPTEEKYLRYQREIVRNKQVALGVEEVTIELSELREFERLVKELSEQHNITINEAQIKDEKIKLRENAAQSTLEKLETVRGEVLIEGYFIVEKPEKDGASQSYFKCIYHHPVNQYLPEGKEITISVLIPAGELYSSRVEVLFQNAVDTPIPLKIYGKVFQAVNMEDDIREIQIMPFVVY